MNAIGVKLVATSMMIGVEIGDVYVSGVGRGIYIQGGSASEINSLILNNIRIYSNKTALDGLGSAIYVQYVKYIELQNIIGKWQAKIVEVSNADSLSINNLYVVTNDWRFDYRFVFTNVGAKNFKNLIVQNINTGNKLTTNSKGIATITGDGVTTSFTVNISHGLVTDDPTKIAVTITPSKACDVNYAFLDTDNDGFTETLQITLTFSTAPASGETIYVSWRAEVVS